MGDERRVRRNDDDDRSVIVARKGSAGVWNIIGDLSADGHARNAEIGTPPVVALHKNSNRVATVFRVQLAGSRANSPLEAIADHSRAAANIAFLNEAGGCAVDGV